MWNVWRRESEFRFLEGILKGKTNLEDLGVDGKIILKGSRG